MPNEQLWAMERESLLRHLEYIENATADQLEKAQGAFGGSSDAPSSPIYTIDGDTALITVSGILVKNRIPAIYRFFGISATSYQDIIRAAEDIEKNPAIQKVRILFATPGGMVDGADETYQAIRSLSTSKEVVAEARGMLASAGYYLAAAAPKIISSSPGNEIGSIGVLVSYVSYKDMDKRLGVKEITVVSSNAPNKAATPETKAGMAVIQQRLNALERVFYQRVSEGRRVTVQHIAEHFGKGGVLVSQDPDQDRPDALSVGMIDAVSGVHTTFKSIQHEGEKSMSTYRPNESQIQAAASVLSGDYPKQLKGLAGDVLAGRAEGAALSIAKATYDSLKPQQTNGTTEQQETAEQMQARETAFQEDINKTRQQMGLPPLPTQTFEEVPTVASSEADYDRLVAASRRQMGIA